MFRAPLLNRAIKGQYPPGSTFKPIDALIALEEGVITPRSGIACSGGIMHVVKELVVWKPGLVMLQTCVSQLLIPVTLFSVILIG
jgi:cell division protein FtsI/penicillin-binding protein 2